MIRIKAIIKAEKTILMIFFLLGLWAIGQYFDLILGLPMRTFLFYLSLEHLNVSFDFQLI